MIIQAKAVSQTRDVEKVIHFIRLEDIILEDRHTLGKKTPLGGSFAGTSRRFIHPEVSVVSHFC